MNIFINSNCRWSLFLSVWKVEFQRFCAFSWQLAHWIITQLSLVDLPQPIKQDRYKQELFKVWGGALHFIWTPILKILKPKWPCWVALAVTRAMERGVFRVNCAAMKTALPAKSLVHQEAGWCSPAPGLSRLRGNRPAHESETRPPSTLD